MSDRHRRIMEFLEAYQNKNQYAPSIREIGNYINVNSTSLVDYYLRQLIDMGYLERDNRISRSIRMIKPYREEGGPRPVLSYSKQDVLRFQILGRIVASAPIPVPGSDLAYFDEESYVEIPRRMLPANEKESELFVLEVSGNSMVCFQVLPVLDPVLRLQQGTGVQGAHHPGRSEIPRHEAEEDDPDPGKKAQQERRPLP